MSWQVQNQLIYTIKNYEITPIDAFGIQFFIFCTNESRGKRETSRYVPAHLLKCGSKVFLYFNKDISLISNQTVYLIIFNNYLIFLFVIVSVQVFGIWGTGASRRPVKNVLDLGDIHGTSVAALDRMFQQTLVELSRVEDASVRLARGLINFNLIYDIIINNNKQYCLSESCYLDPAVSIVTGSRVVGKTFEHSRVIFSVVIICIVVSYANFKI